LTIVTTISTSDMRDWLGLKTTDTPSDAVITKHINWCLVPMSYEIGVSEQTTVDYLVLLKAGAQLMKWLARRSVKNGYIEFSGELLELAQDLEKDYNDFCSISGSEIRTTKFLNSLTSNTISDLQDLWQGVSNAFTYQSQYHPSVTNNVRYY